MRGRPLPELETDSGGVPSLSRTSLTVVFPDFPCFFKITGNFSFFRRPYLARKWRKTHVFSLFSRDFACLGTGNANLRNREFHRTEQGLHPAITGNQIAAPTQNTRQTELPGPFNGILDRHMGQDARCVGFISRRVGQILASAGRGPLRVGYKSHSVGLPRPRAGDTRLR